MITKLFKILGSATDVRTIAAIVAGALTTILGAGHLSATVIGVVDGVAGLIVTVDTFQLHKAAQQLEANDHDTFKSLAVRAGAPDAAPPATPSSPAPTGTPSRTEDPRQWAPDSPPATA